MMKKRTWHEKADKIAELTGRRIQVTLGGDWKHFSANTSLLLEGHSPGLLHSTSGWGKTVKQAVEDLWDRLTTLKAGGWDYLVLSQGVRTPERWVWDADKDNWRFLGLHR